MNLKNLMHVNLGITRTKGFMPATRVENLVKKGCIMLVSKWKILLQLRQMKLV